MTQSEARKIWVEALRSGKYKQGYGRLRVSMEHMQSEDGFCCLGVACDLYQQHEETYLGWKKNDVQEEGGIYWAFSHVTGSLPLEVMRWLGLSSVDGALASSKARVAPTLSYLNDKGESFEGIADVIESGQVLLKEDDDDA